MFSSDAHHIEKEITAIFMFNVHGLRLVLTVNPNILKNRERHNFLGIVIYKSILFWNGNE